MIKAFGMVEGVAIVVRGASVNLYLGPWRFYFAIFAERVIEYSIRFN